MCTVKELQLFIRSGGFAWPGGYPCLLLMADGESIDAQSARENYRLVRRADSTDWKPMEVFVHWEGAPIQCAHSGRMVESAYGEADA
jgi:hypothetical protein